MRELLIPMDVMVLDMMIQVAGAAFVAQSLGKVF